jgi:SAM-dependent methyltransferase
MNDLDLDKTRATYDAVAASYAALVAGDLARQPVERSLLSLFAELASGPTADVGSGPGQVTAFLHEQGLDVFGVDLSPVMVDQARTAYPHLRFEAGSMTRLDEPDGSLAGLNARLSIIHIPDGELPGVLAEFRRVLAPDAPLMLTFQLGDTPKHFTQAWGRDVDMTIHRRRPETVAEMLTTAGFHVFVTTVFAPAGAPPGSQVASLIAR